MSTPHLEVIPRIIDTSIAASYQVPAKPSSVAGNESNVVPNGSTAEPKTGAAVTAIPYVPPTFTQRFFSKLKDYAIPILFIIAVMVVIYIVWKYWTTYRNVATITVESQPVIDSFDSNKPDNPPEDLSRFLLTDDNSDDENESVHSKLSTIIENNEDTDNDADEESSDEEEEDDESDNESVVSAPDFSVISNLINQPIDDYSSARFEYLQPDNESYLQKNEFNSDDEEEKEEEPDYLFDIKSTTSSIHTEAVTDQNNDQDIDDDVTDTVTELVELVVEPVKEVVKPKAKKSKKPKRIVL